MSKKEQKVERVGRIYKHSVLRNSLQKIMMYKGANYRPFEDEISIIGGHKPKGTEFDSISFMMDQN